MRRKSYRSYLILALLLLLLVSSPRKAQEQLRSLALSSLIPSWESICRLRVSLAAIPSEPLSASPSEIARLRQENVRLREQVESMKEWLLFEDRLEQQFERLKSLSKVQEDDLFWKEFFRRRNEHLAERISVQLQALPARVVFREPVSWSSFLWLNVGDLDNEAMGKVIVAKNSPVILGESIVGVVETVERRRCLVRLITDSRLVPSVRAVRESGQGALFLAKGELRGSSSASWRRRDNTLKGVGFNYDFVDEEGPSRDLRTGEIKGSGKKTEKIALIQKGDLLVTTGMDGVFPPGFRVAIVSEVSPLREGASSYELKAEITAGSLDEVKELFVLPPS